MSYSPIRDESKWSIRQMLIDLACGVAATFLQFVFIIAFAAGCFSSYRTSPLFGCGIVMSALPTICTQMLYCWQSEVPFYFVVPDGFYIPLLNALAVTLSNEIEDDEIFRHTFLCAIVVTTCTVGFAKFISGAYNLLQFTDYIPYPAICGLMAGIGINLIQVGFHMSMSKETDELSYSIILPAIVFSILSIISSKMKMNTSTSFVLLLLLSFFSFNTYIYLFQIPQIKLYENNWVYSSHGNLKQVWIYFVNELMISSNRNKINWVAIYKLSDQILSIAVLMVLKISLTIPAYEKALQRRFDKSKEFVKYGAVTVGAGLLGAVGTTPALSVLALVAEMGGGERVPGMIAPILVLLLLFTNFQCVMIVPKFVFIGLLLTSGYSMVMAWLIAPMYRIPQAEAVIIVIIVGMFLSQGMLFAIGMGAVLSVFLFIYQFHGISCIKFISSGSVFRSTEERSDLITMKLKKYRHRIIIIQLQGYLTFSNSSQILDAVVILLESDDNGHELSTGNATADDVNQQQLHRDEDVEPLKSVTNIAEVMSSASGIGYNNRRLSIRRMSDESKSPESPASGVRPSPPWARDSLRLLQAPRLGLSSDTDDVEAFFQASDQSHSQTQLPTVDEDDGHDEESEFDRVVRPCALILHMNDVVGCDASGMDTFSQIVRLCQLKNCQLHLAAVSDKDIILMQKSGLVMSKFVTVSKSLDDALKSSEDILIQQSGLDSSISSKCFVTSEKGANSGFLRCLEVIQNRYPKVEVSKLSCLERYCEFLEFSPGQTITSSDRKATATTSDGGLKLPQIKLKDFKKTVEDDPAGLFFLDSGVIQHLVAIQSDNPNHKPLPIQIKCSSKHDPGWVFEEFDTQVYLTRQDRDVNVYCAHTACTLYHISSANLKMASLEHPGISMVLMRLQNAVLKRQLTAATEQVSNFADVLRFNGSRPTHVKQP